MLLEIYIGERKNINLLSLLKKSLGSNSKYLGGGLFLFLFYLIITAYLNASSILIQNAIQQSLKIELSNVIVLFLNSLLMFFLLLLGTRKIEFINRIFFFLMIAFYFCLVAFGVPKVEAKNIVHIGKFSAAFLSIPVFIVSFGFQNLIPTISHYLAYETSRIKLVLFRGTLITFFVYLIWNFVVLGIVSKQNSADLTTGSIFITHLLNDVSGKVTIFISNFSFCAIVTSLLAVSLSFVNFLADSSENPKNRAIYAACVIAPPTVFCLFNPTIFLGALHLAGGIGAVCLFGVLPALMLWKTRYSLNRNYPPIFPFGKKFLIAYLLISAGIVVIEVMNVIHG